MIVCQYILILHKHKYYLQKSKETLSRDSDGIYLRPVLKFELVFFIMLL